MKNIILIITIFCISNYSFSEEKEISVNDVLINKNLISFIKNEVNKEGIKITDKMEKNIIKRLIDLELIHQQATKEGLTSKLDFLSKSELAFKELIYTTYLQNFIKKNDVTENDIKKAYENYKNNFNELDYKASHILVTSKNEAKKIIKDLKEGADFSNLAKTMSIDEESKAIGGNLGWFNAEDMVESFSNALKKLVVKEITGHPVQSQFGWHIIKLNQVRKKSAPSLSEKEEEIKLTLQKEKLKSHIDELRLIADIKK
ncbi:MAG: peptidylprolyl isomerase [Methylophilaceae bacterium]